MKIWCVFSIKNDYNQPDNNLVCWFSNKPSADDLKILVPEIGIRGATALAEYGVCRSGGDDYRLQAVEEKVTI